MTFSLLLLTHRPPPQNQPLSALSWVSCTLLLKYLTIYIAYAHFISLRTLWCNNYATTSFPLWQQILYICRVYFYSFCNTLNLPFIKFKFN